MPRALGCGRAELLPRQLPQQQSGGRGVERHRTRLARYQAVQVGVAAADDVRGQRRRDAIPRDAKAPTGWGTNPSPVVAYSFELPLPGL
ncbi:hypothetical protein ACLESD_00375 [Pyxidicoccus sp. 3LFB2]